MLFWKSWRHKNLVIFFLSVVFALILSKVETFNLFLLNLGNFGYIGAFIAGFLFVSTFTVATGTLILLTLARILSPIEIGIAAGFGAVLGDFIIFRFIRDNLAQDLKSIYNHVDSTHHFEKILHSRYFSWTLPVIGAIIIASPFPDEIGVSLMGISKMKKYQFLLISFFLNSIGIFLVISASLFI